VPQTYDSVDFLKPYDFMYVLDLRCRLWQQLKLGFRFEYSLLSLRTRTFPGAILHEKEIHKQYNNTLSLYLVYVFNEKKTNSVDREKKKEKRYYY
jgi:hypothetical protein